MTPSKEEARECPFCQCADNISVNQPGESGPEQRLWQVQCIANDCANPIVEGETEADALALWNTRATLPPQHSSGDVRELLAAGYDEGGYPLTAQAIRRGDNFCGRDDIGPALRAIEAALPTPPDLLEVDEQLKRLELMDPASPRCSAETYIKGIKEARGLLSQCRQKRPTVAMKPSEEAAMQAALMGSVKVVGKLDRSVPDADDEALIGRLRRKARLAPVLGGGSFDSDGKGASYVTDDGMRLVNPDGPAAARRIEALASRSAPDGWVLVRRDVLEPFAKWMARIDETSAASSEGRLMPDSYHACRIGLDGIPTMGELRALVFGALASSPSALSGEGK